MIYPCKINTWINGNDFSFVAESLSLKYCIGCGNTMQKAFTELEENETELLKSAKKLGIPISEISKK